MTHLLKIIFLVLFLSSLISCTTKPVKTVKPIKPIVKVDNYSQRKESIRYINKKQAIPEDSVLLVSSRSSLRTSANIKAVPPVKNLMQQANVQAQNGDFNSAAASLERAVSIQPKYAPLWHQLATVRAQQGHYKLALQLTRKSNTLAVNQPRLKQKNWRLVYKIKTAKGDHRGAAYALQKVQELEE
jgi:Flp pilus assembly protein TadD